MKRRAPRRAVARIVLVAGALGCGGGAASDPTPPDTAGAIDTPDTPVDTPDTPHDETGAPPATDCGAVTPVPAAPVVVPSDSAFSAEVLDRGDRSPCVWIEDLDADGHTDHGWFSRSDGDRVWTHWGGPDAVTTSITLPPGTTHVQGACTVFDRDRDGDLDIVFTRNGDLAALDLSAGRTLTLRTRLADLPPDLYGPQWLAPIPLPGDDIPDLLAGFYGEQMTQCVAPTSLTAPDTTTSFRSGAAVCWIADGEGRFTPDDGSHCPAPVLEQSTPFCNNVSLADFNGDGNTDAFFSGDYAPNELLWGGSDNALLRTTAPTGVEVFNHAMGSAVADFDGDGRLDLFVTDAGTNDLYTQAQCGQFFQASRAVGLDVLTGRTVTWGVSTRDFDQNGAPDLLVGNSMELADRTTTGSLCDLASTVPYPPSILLLNDGTAGFTRVDVPDLSPAPGPGWFGGVRIATGDVDGDGDDDAIVSTTYGTTLLRNQIPAQGAWLRVRPLDTSGRPAVGSRITARQPSGGRTVDLWSDYGFAGHSELTAAFAFAADEVVTIDVRWPDGAMTTLAEVPLRQRVVVRRP